MSKLVYFVAWKDLDDPDLPEKEMSFSESKKAELLRFLRIHSKLPEVGNLTVTELDYDWNDATYQAAIDKPVATKDNMEVYIQKLQNELDGKNTVEDEEAVPNKTLFRLMVRVTEDSDIFTDFTEYELKRFLGGFSYYDTSVDEFAVPLPKGYKIVSKEFRHDHRTTKSLPQKTMISARTETNADGTVVYIPDETGEFKVIVPAGIITNKEVFEKAFFEKKSKAIKVTSFEYDAETEHYKTYYEEEFFLYDLTVKDIVALASVSQGTVRMYRSAYLTGKWLRYDDSDEKVYVDEKLVNRRSPEYSDCFPETVDYVQVELEIGW